MTESLVASKLTGAFTNVSALPFSVVNVAAIQSKPLTSSCNTTNQKSICLLGWHNRYRGDRRGARLQLETFA